VSADVVSSVVGIFPTARASRGSSAPCSGSSTTTRQRSATTRPGLTHGFHLGTTRHGAGLTPPPRATASPPAPASRPQETYGSDSRERACLSQGQVVADLLVDEALEVTGRGLRRFPTVSWPLRHFDASVQPRWTKTHSLNVATRQLLVPELTDEKSVVFHRLPVSCHKVAPRSRKEVPR